MTERNCRVCGAGLKHTFADLGLSPLANSYVPMDHATSGEKFYPLHVFVCGQCFLVQLDEFESPESIFSNYAYFSSYSKSWTKHAENYAAAMTERFSLDERSKVVEVASNDGYLLQYFVGRGIPVLGVEPAANVAKAAIERKVPTEVTFFTEKSAGELRSSGHGADLMAANNVLAHVPDILDFMRGFAVLLKPEGVATFEFPHLLRLMEETQFDTIYHEHFSYLSLTIVERIARQSGLRVFDVEELPTHGGSLRVFVCHNASGHKAQPAVGRIIEQEKAAGLLQLSGYRGFAENVIRIKCAALQFFIQARTDGKTVAAYGAAAKGNTFLNYCGVGPEFVRAVADSNPHKQNTLLPGSRIPVISPEELLALKPDYILILPWNLKDEIAGELAPISRWGGRCVTAIPELKIL
jgi:SAM-dependent methyltransferase